MKRRPRAASNPDALLAMLRGGRTVRDYRKGQTIFLQGGAEAVFFVERGEDKLTVLSRHDKQAVILSGRGEQY